MDGEPLSVSDLPEASGKALVTLPGPWMSMLRFAGPMRGRVGEVRTTGSIAYELAMTARGVFQYMITLTPNLWDIAAGAAIVSEAGGTVMLGRRPTGPLSVGAAIRWTPVGSLVPGWRDGETTLADLRRWSMPMAFGAPGPVRDATSHVRLRSRWWRRTARRLRRSFRLP